MVKTLLYNAECAGSVPGQRAKIPHAPGPKKNKTKNTIKHKQYHNKFNERLKNKVPIKESFFTPNNILAIEYIKALIRTHSNITPYTIKRKGADYNCESIIDSRYQSASAIRNQFAEDANFALDFLPKTSKNTITTAIEQGELPCDTEKLSPAVLSYFRLSSPTSACDIHDADGGLYNRLIASSIKATSINDLTKLASTKKYTIARIKRAMWSSFFGVTSSDVRTPPRYTQVLAVDSVGQALLKRIKKAADFPIVTKPSSSSNLDEIALRQKRLSDTSDFIYELSKPCPSSADKVFKAKPFVKKGE